MEMKVKLIRLENAGVRYILSVFLIFYNLVQMSTAYNRYDRYLLEYPNTADDFLNLFYFALVMIIVVVGLVIFFGVIDYTVKNKDKYLILKDDTLLIPNAITNKVKVINLTDIDNIGLEGMMQEKVKINMKTSDFILAPRLYNAFDKDIKEIYNTLNELLVAKNISQR